MYFDVCRSLKLSLNGKEVLNADDDESLASLGFVSGDAIYIICASSSKFENKVQEVGRQPSSSHQNVDMKSTSEERHTQDSCQPVQPPTPSASQDVMLSSGLQIWETPPNQVPSSYSLLVDSNPGKLQSPIEQLGGLLHLLMVEVGFHPETSKVLQPGCSPLPDSWALRSGTLKLQYKSMLPPNPSCTLVITEIGPVVMVHGTVAALDVKTVSLKLKIGDYVSPIGRNLAQLSRTFKDDIAFPLLCSMQRETKGVCLPNLSNLPLEILNKILLLLDAQTICRLAATCRFFQYLANQPELWKRLTIRYCLSYFLPIFVMYTRSVQPSRKFGQEFAKKTTAESDWKKVYKEEHEKELRERRYVERQRSIPVYSLALEDNRCNGLLHFFPRWNPKDSLAILIVGSPKFFLRRVEVSLRVSFLEYRTDLNFPTIRSPLE